MATANKVLRADALRNAVAGEMEFLGKTHNVLQPTLGQRQIIEAVESAPTIENGEELKKVIRALVPTMSDEDFLQINSDIVVAITLLAGANIDAVEAAFPNAVSPVTAATPSTSPG